MWLDAGYNIDEYFYSEGYSTGSDGILGNENLCIRDDTNQVYFGREDVCSNRQISGYDYIHLDQNFNLALLDTSSITIDTNLITNVFDTPTGGEIQTTWDGCYTISYDNGGDGSWNGESGGSCPNIGINSGAIRWGYIQQTLSQTFSINEALKAAGIEVEGYNYRWTIKNADGNYQDSNGCCGKDDPFYIEIAVLNDDGEKVYSKVYDYSYEISDWNVFSGSDTFAEGLSLQDISEIELNVTGKDAGFWAGYYGPEFRDYKVDFRYRVTPQEDTTIQDLLFQQQCDLDPFYSYQCPSYQQAMLDAIADTGVFYDEEDTFLEENNDGYQDSEFEDGSTYEGDSGSLAEDGGTFDDDISDNEESISEEYADVSEETDVSEESTSSSGESSGGGATPLNSTQLAALNAAQDVSNKAEAVAAEQAQVGAASGLSENGGVSSNMTGEGSVDSVSMGSSDTLSLLSDTSDAIFSTDDMEFFSDENVLTDEKIQSTDNNTTIFDISEITDANNNIEQVAGVDTQEKELSDISGNDTFETITESDTFIQEDVNDGQSDESYSLTTDNEYNVTDITLIDESSTTEFALSELELNSTINYGNDSQQNDVQDNEETVIETQDITGEEALAQSLENNQVIDTQVTINTIPLISELDFVGRFVADFISSLPEITEPEEQEEVDEDLEAFKEAVLVGKALKGDDSEDSKVALLGYNPAFSSYLTNQMADGKTYESKDVYTESKNYDNPNSRFFNGASDIKHEQLIELQYRR